MVAVRVKVVWSSVRVVPGVLCVMMLGELMMLLWSADSWDMLPLVSLFNYTASFRLNHLLTQQMPLPIVWLGLGRVVDPSTWTRWIALVVKQCWEIVLPIQLVCMIALTLKMLELAAKVRDLHLYVG